MGLALAIGLTLMGCRGSLPTEEQGKTAILNTIKQDDHAGAIKLLSFRKTNGMVHEGLGVKGYIMEVECDIEFTRDCHYVENDFRTEVVGYWNRVNCQRGQRGKVSSKLMFEKTENGWRPR